MTASPDPATESLPKAKVELPDHRLGHKKRQRARNRELKRNASHDVMGRLPPFSSLPLASMDPSGGDSTGPKGLSDLYQPIPRREASFREFWASVPSVCNPNTAILEERISDERELSMDRYHSEKYRRKLQYKKAKGEITQGQLEELWEKHGKRTLEPRTTPRTATDVKGGNEGVSLLSNDRGQRKAWQVENFVSILWDRLSSYTTTTDEPSDSRFDFTIVDFGCGSGNLCLALAPYFSRVRFVLVDKKPYPLKLAERRANEAGLKNVQTLQFSFSPSNLDDFSIPSMSDNKPKGLFLPPGCTVDSTITLQNDSSSPNVRPSSRDFDIAIGLHCCGSFTDMVMSLAQCRDADCIVCPCCNGAMTSKTACGYTYPRSSYIGKFMNQDEYLSISKAAEDNGIYEAKCLIEYDRALWANENGYHTQLLKMTPENCTPKHHVLYLRKKESMRT